MRGGLDEELYKFLFIDGKQYFIYGDSSYNVMEFITVPFRGANLNAQNAFNRAMSKVIVTAGWLFKKLKLYWSTVDYKRKILLSQSPMGALYIATLLLTNMQNFVYSNTVPQYFSCLPPSLEGYVLH